MAEVTIQDLQKPKARKGAVREKTVLRSDGRRERVFSIDANSATFADDLTILFARNVARARRENKRLFGSPSGFAAKKKK